MVCPGVAPSEASSDCAHYGASSDDFWGGGSGGIGLAGGTSLLYGSTSDT